MDIRIDTGSGDTGQVYDEEVMEGAIVEVVEEPQVPAAQPTMAPPKAPKKPGRKKAIMAIAVVFLIVVVVLIAYIMIPQPPSSIDVTANEATDGHSLWLYLGISMRTATEASGEAKVTITYDGEPSYSNSNWKISSNAEQITIPYSDFVMGNGFHTIEVEFQGVSDTSTFEAKHVIEDAIIVADDEVINEATGQAKFTLRVNFDTKSNELPGDADMKVKAIEHEDGVHDVKDGIGTWESVTGQRQYEDDINYDESGNYTLTVTIRNNDVKSDSAYHEFDVENDEIMLNAVPIAKIETTEGDGDENGQVSVGTTVHFDGRSTIDDGDNIEEYDWFFEDTQSHSYGPEVDHTFNFVNPAADRNDWSVTLTVTDNGHGEDGREDHEMVLIVVTL
ncbi:MAG: hypothetical protein JSW28_06535 [Thermoplasmata archaeon]|nr:MAG: hypothetical protein JSW28_06535 [Thermoplasmata archaeon]